MSVEEFVRCPNCDGDLVCTLRFDPPKRDGTTAHLWCPACGSYFSFAPVIPSEAELTPPLETPPIA